MPILSSKKAELADILSPLTKLTERLQTFLDESAKEIDENAVKIKELNNRTVSLGKDRNQAHTIMENFRNFLAASVAK